MTHKSFWESKIIEIIKINKYIYVYKYITTIKINFKDKHVNLIYK